MTKLEFVAENGNIRIDKYIADNEPSLTRTAAAKLIEQGKVFVNENSVYKIAYSAADNKRNRGIKKFALWFLFKHIN